jgi:two-component system, sporulation sensor kinase B
MISIIKPLIVNIAIIFSLTFIANMIIPVNLKEKYSIRVRVLYGLISSFAAILCMVYPIEKFESAVFDLRTVPLIVSTQYLGFIPGFITACAIIAGRLVIGGPYAWIGCMITVAALIIPLLFYKLSSPEKRKWKYSISIGLVFIIVYLLILMILLDFLEPTFYLAYFCTFTTAYFFIIYLCNHLNRINARLEETIYLDKLSVLGQMAAAIAHEVRNPLTTVRGLIQFISKDTKDDKLNQYAPLIIDELDRTNRIISDYLTMVKPQSENIEVIEIGKVIIETVNLVNPLASYNNVEINTHLERKLFVKGDRQQYKQSLLNLIKNAIEALENGGEINIFTTIMDKEDTVEIKIVDNGKGMTPEELKTIGLPFYTTKKKGTGLGTMITKNLINKNGGKIEYQSEVDTGTTVIISLPLA